MQIIFLKPIVKEKLIHSFQNETTVINKLKPLFKVKKTQKTQNKTNNKARK